MEVGFASECVTQRLFHRTQESQVLSQYIMDGKCLGNSHGSFFKCLLIAMFMSNLQALYTVRYLLYMWNGREI